MEKIKVLSTNVEKTAKYTKHIFDAIDSIERYLKDKNYEEFKENSMLQDAVIRKIEVIGEATKKLSGELREKNREIPWKQITGMRDKLIHKFSEIDLDVVWDTTNKDIPLLKVKLQKILELENRNV